MCLASTCYCELPTTEPADDQARGLWLSVPDRKQGSPSKKKKLNKKFKNNSVTGNTPNWSYWKMWQAAEHSPCCHRLLFLSGVICEVTILVFSGKCQSALGFKHMMYTVSCWSSFCNTLAVLLLFLLPQEELWTLC